MTPTQALKRYSKAPKGFRNRALVRLQDVNLATLQKKSKYKNRKVVKNGETFDSVREYERHLVLSQMQRDGEIKDLKRQPRFKLFVHGALICTYVADWEYVELIDRGGGRTRSQTVVEDAKGFQTPEFKLKWKLAQALNPYLDFRLS